MVPDAGKKWISVLEPVLSEFVASYEGNVNHKFWQRMVKKVQHGAGSGSYSTISGWITILYHELDKYHMPWQMMESANGPEPTSFPKVLSSAPVFWEYHGTPLDLHFHAGFLGATQDSTTRALRCCVGWAVSHDPPKAPAKRIPELEQLLNDINRSGDSSSNAKWRIRTITEELKKLQS